MLEYSIPVTFRHRAFFTRDAFCADNATLIDAFDSDNLCDKRILCLVEESVALDHPYLTAQAGVLFDIIAKESTVVTLAGGELAKNSMHLVDQVHHLVDHHHIDRHSFIVCVGGGAFLDAVGFGAATAHRGIRLIRMPSTTLAQCDSGVGVKNGVNLFGKKNFNGSFAVPWAVVNDFSLLATQPAETRHIGLVEALKVGLIKDAAFVEFIASHVDELNAFDEATVEHVIKESARLHMEHIATGGDPFENGSSRPLDFGHWAAHKLEQMTNFEFSHAEAVAVGLTLDVLYSARSGLLDEAVAQRIIQLVRDLNYPTHHPAMLDRSVTSGELTVLAGLTEFREHLGGQLTVCMLTAIGHGIDVHEIDHTLMDECIHELNAALIPG